MSFEGIKIFIEKNAQLGSKGKWAIRTWWLLITGLDASRGLQNLRFSENGHKEGLLLADSNLCHHLVLTHEQWISNKKKPKNREVWEQS